MSIWNIPRPDEFLSERSELFIGREAAKRATISCGLQAIEKIENSVYNVW